MFTESCSPQTIDQDKLVDTYLRVISTFQNLKASSLFEVEVQPITNRGIGAALRTTFKTLKDHGSPSEGISWFKFSALVTAIKRGAFYIKEKRKTFRWGELILGSKISFKLQFFLDSSVYMDSVDGVSSLMGGEIVELPLGSSACAFVFFFRAAFICLVSWLTLL